MTRPSVNRMLLNIAGVVAERSTCSRLAVGAVLARNGRVLSTGYNGAPSGIAHCKHEAGDDKACTVSVHAEENVVAQAARHGVVTEDACLYLTHAPCLHCSGVILSAGIKAVFYELNYKSDEGVARLRQSRVDVYHVSDQVEETSLDHAKPWKWW